MSSTASFLFATVMTVAVSAAACGSEQPVEIDPVPIPAYELQLVGSSPATGISGAVLPSIEIQAALVSPVGPTFTGDNTISVSQGSGLLVGTTSRSAVNGHAVFGGLSIVGVGPQVLRAQASDITPLDLAPITMSLPAETPVAPPTLLDAIDLGNAGTGADFRVRLRWSTDHAEIEEYRLVAYVYDAAGTVPPTREAILALPAQRYLAVYPAEQDAWIPFSEASVDITGAPLVEGVPYRVVAVAVHIDSARTSAVSGFTPTLSTKQASYIETIATIGAGTGGLALDNAGNLYMADFGATLDGPPGQVVYRIPPDHSVTVFANGFQGASGNAFDANGNLFQSSIVGGFVSRIAPNGSVEPYVSGLNQPVGIVTTSNGELYVTSCGANAIMHVAADKTVTTYFADAGLLKCPNGIARAPDGTLYVANFGNGSVIKILPTKTGSVLTQLPGGNLGHLSLVGDQLYIAGRGANRLYKLDLDGNATVIAGTGARGLRDGTALEATLSLTNDVVMSADGRTLYFNDVIGTPNRVISPAAVRALHLVPGN